MTAITLVWDGRCLADKAEDAVDSWKNRASWLNARIAGDGSVAPPQPEIQPLTGILPLHSDTVIDVQTLSTQFSEITIESVDNCFAPIEEFANITLNIKDLAAIGGLIMQVRNRANRLVYAEKLSKEQVWGLAGKVTPTQPDVGDETKDQLKWANPTDSPYFFFIFNSSLTPDKLPDLDQAPNRGTVKRSFGEDANAQKKGFVINSVKGFEETEVEIEAQTSIRVHSLDIVRAPWDPEEKLTPQMQVPEAEEEKGRWMRWRLNELGFFGGPFKQDVDAYQKKALTRFRANHKDLYRYDHADYAQDLSDALPQIVNKLKGGENKRDDFTRPTDIGTRQQITAGKSLSLADKDDKLRIIVESLTFMKNVDKDELVDQYTQGSTRNEVERARLNRPLIPIEARVYIQGKNGKNGFRVPEAVGAVRINWSHTEPVEDVDRQFEEVKYWSYPRRYIEKALKLRDGRKGETCNNCPDAYGGIRKDADTNYKTPFLLGAYYSPCTLQDDGTKKVVYSKAYDGRVIDGKTYKRRLGSAGIYFRPSCVAGDTYKIKAAVDPSRLDPKQPDVETTTNPIEIWRYAKVAGLINWSDNPLPDVWRRVRKEYAVAFMDIDVDSITTQTAAEVIETLVYTNWVGQNIIEPSRAMYDEAYLKSVFNMQAVPENAMFELEEPDQLKKVPTDLKRQLAAIVPSTLNRFVRVIARESKEAGVELTQILRRLRFQLNTPDFDVTDLKALQTELDQVDITLETGLKRLGIQFDADILEEFLVKLGRSKKILQIIVETMISEVKQSREGIIINLGWSYLSENAYTNLWERIFSKCRRLFTNGLTVMYCRTFNQEFKKADLRDSGACSQGFPNGGVMINKNSPGNHVYYIVCHEMGHCFLLNHGINNSERIKDEAPGKFMYEEHDPLDQNCIMDYGHIGDKVKHPHRTAETYQPHFCGKCNLKLRGWDVRHQEILQLDAEDRTKLEENGERVFVAYFDNEDSKLENKHTETKIVEDAFNGVFTGRFFEHSFDRAHPADIDTWLGNINGCDIYHQITHGNARCSKHKKRIKCFDQISAYPRYPVWCPKKKLGTSNLAWIRQTEVRFNQLVRHLTHNDPDNFTKGLNQFAQRNFITPRIWGHKPRGVIQWTMDNSEPPRIPDIEFTFEAIEGKFKGGQLKPPKILAFFSSCMLGWEMEFPRLFIKYGTKYVISFRAAAFGTDCVTFTKTFYDKWAESKFSPDEVRNTFLFSVKTMPYYLTPVLFYAGGIIKAYAKYTDIAKNYDPDTNIVTQRLSWDDKDEFYKDRFPSPAPQRSWVRYTLTIQGGTITNPSDTGTYLSGRVVSITADEPQQGMLFDKWTGDTDIIVGPNQKDAEVKTKEGNATLTATYKEDPFRLQLSAIDPRLRSRLGQEDHQEMVDRRRKNEQEDTESDWDDIEGLDEEYTECPQCGEFMMPDDGNQCLGCGFEKEDTVPDLEDIEGLDQEFTECPECGEFLMPDDGNTCLGCGFEKDEESIDGEDEVDVEEETVHVREEVICSNCWEFNETSRDTCKACGAEL